VILPSYPEIISCNELILEFKIYFLSSSSFVGYIIGYRYDSQICLKILLDDTLDE